MLDANSTLFHCVEPDEQDDTALMYRHNVALTDGLICPEGAKKHDRRMIKHEGMISSPYALRGYVDRKEMLFEKIRNDEFPTH